jgi:hypothetical protein
MHPVEVDILGSDEFRVQRKLQIPDEFDNGLSFSGSWGSLDESERVGLVAEQTNALFLTQVEFQVGGVFG